MHKFAKPLSHLTASYTRLINIAQAWLLPVAAVSSLDDLSRPRPSRDPGQRRRYLLG